MNGGSWIADYWVLVGPDGLAIGSHHQPLLYRTRREARAALREFGWRGVRVGRVEAHLREVRS